MMTSAEARRKAKQLLFAASAMMAWQSWSRDAGGGRPSRAYGPTPAPSNAGKSVSLHSSDPTSCTFATARRMERRQIGDGSYLYFHLPGASGQLPDNVQQDADTGRNRFTWAVGNELDGKVGLRISKAAVIRGI